MTGKRTDYASMSEDERTILRLAIINLFTCMAAPFNAREYIAAVRRGSAWIARSLHQEPVTPENQAKLPRSIRINFKAGTARKG